MGKAVSTAVQLAVAKAEASVPSSKTELVADERAELKERANEANERAAAAEERAKEAEAAAAKTGGEVHLGRRSGQERSSQGSRVQAIARG